MASTIKAKISRPFMFNGRMLQVGEAIDMDFDRAVRHMRVGDVERDEKAVEIYKNKMIGRANATIKQMDNF